MWNQHSKKTCNRYTKVPSLSYKHAFYCLVLELKYSVPLVFLLLFLQHNDCTPTIEPLEFMLLHCKT